MSTGEPVGLSTALTSFDEVHSPRIVARVNDSDVRIAASLGEHGRQVNEHTDAFFLVRDGRFDVAVRQPGGAETTVALQQGDTFVGPRGTEHEPSSTGGSILMFEPTGTVTTGDADVAVPGHVDRTAGHEL